MASDERAGRVAATRRRHGDDFYARIGRKSQELRRRAAGGDGAAREALARHRAAKAGRGDAWLELVAAREAVTLLREELRSRARADAEPARALLPAAFAYGDQLRRELAGAEQRLTQCRAAHRRLLRDLAWTPGVDEVAPTPG